MADDQTPLDDELDPTEDTPDESDEDTDAAETPDPKSPEERQKEAQRKITALSQENARLRAATSDDDEDAEESDEPTDEFAAKFESESWALAEAVYGSEAIEAYRVAEQLGTPQSPADWVGTFEAYYNARIGNGDTAPAAKAGGDPLEPRDADLGPDLQTANKKLTEARKGSDLGNFAAAAAAAMGFSKT